MRSSWGNGNEAAGRGGPRRRTGGQRAPRPRRRPPSRAGPSSCRGWAGPVVVGVEVEALEVDDHARHLVAAGAEPVGPRREQGQAGDVPRPVAVEPAGQRQQLVAAMAERQRRACRARAGTWPRVGRTKWSHRRRELWARRHLDRRTGVAAPPSDGTGEPWCGVVVPMRAITRRRRQTHFIPMGRRPRQTLHSVCEGTNREGADGVIPQRHDRRPRPRTDRRPHVLVLGGGFGGIGAARKLTGPTSTSR